MAVSLADIQADIGEMYDSVENGTTSVNSLIQRAEDYVVLFAGTTTGNDVITRPLADAMVVNHILGGIDPVNKTIGTLSVGEKDLRTMQQFFMNEAKKTAILKGYSVDGLNIIFKDTAEA